MGLIDKKVGDFSLGDAMVVGLAKYVTEKVQSPIIGNGTLMSGAVKLGEAYFLPKMWKSPLGKNIGTALAVDGVEDLINGAMGSFGGSSNEGGNLI